MKRSSRIALALIITAACSTLVRAGETVDQTLPANPDVSVEVENVSGSVKVTGWDRNEVRITGTLGDDVDGLDVESRSGRIVVEVDIPDSRGRHRRDIECDLELRVPKGAQLEVETVSASIDVSGVTGTLELEAVSGNVDVTGAVAAVEAESVSGSITVSGNNTRVSAESVSGSVELDGVSGRVDASTVSGEIDVDAGIVERGDFESVSGTIQFVGELSRSARFDANSHSGNIVLVLPAGTAAEWEVSTFSGNVENEFGPEARRTSKYVPAKSLEFETGDGEAQISVETFSGNVRLRRR